MKKRKDTHLNMNQEVNLKLFLQKLYRHKWIFLGGIALCLAIAFAYIKLATPTYEVATSILIDPSGNSRLLGESQYVDGGVGLIEMEKNLYNEIGIIQSFSLVSQTVEDLDFEVSYHAKNILKSKEYYGYFPFEVDLIDEEVQLYNTPFEITLLANDKYRLTISTSGYKVSNPVNGSTSIVDKKLKFSKIYSFGERVAHRYFNFTIQKPDYEVFKDDFENKSLQFVVHHTDDLTNDYLSNLEVNNIDIQASIFKLVTTGAVVEKEVAFLKKLTDNYVQNKLVSRNRIASSKETFIRNQLALVADTLLKAESELESFKKNKRAVNLGATAINALDQSQNLQMERAKIAMDIEYNKSLIDYVENNKNSDDFAIPTSTGIDDSQANENITELKRLYAERSRKKFFVTENNQEMSMLNAQINETTEALLNDLKSTNRSSEFALEGLNQQIGRYNGVISSLPTREKQLLNIQRQSNLYENLFNYLSQELAKTGIARAESISDTRVLDEARMVGDKPVAPQKMLILILAFILGFLFPLAWMLWFSPNDIIHNVGQIMANSDLPVIASVTFHDTNSKKSKADISLWNIKESFRDLTANLRFIRPKEGSSVLGITSIMPEEGKTFCAINLGISLAEAGYKTILIDTDLRNPSLVDGIKKIEGKGLSNYLAGDIAKMEEIIYPHEKLSNLKFIPTSVAESNIHELLSGEKMKMLIDQLRVDYDYIILDTPAVGLVSDFKLFSEEIDINLFVIRRKVAKIGFLEDLEKLIPKGKRKKSCIVFNDTLEKYHKYGYGQKYGVNREPKLVNKTLSV
ncbi:GumC family protein [Muriicola sp. Z0-33]|uniref:GumC family protein n=1 Tax=Muriicola sp. Z0-33 TaxID=2816957 RepID=UPI002238BAAD|nr:polysaccharide biosynthesis tyrosine autokinase [Muriicola sp. Z0-33]MCW5515672.1 polysaccharide biosynthesis tyrosine autokinase [Muriicola sp. Z0-33]